MSEAPNAAQAEFWNQTAGPTWVQLQEQLDRQIEGVGLEAMRVLRPEPGERVLDVGCGCGQTTLELAARVGDSGAATGVDISAPMLEVARARTVPKGAATPHFHELDVQTADLGRAAFDAAFSRFGVMFFADPAAAFANIRGALRPSGRLAFVCWRSVAENPIMSAPAAAAAPFLPPSPPSDPTAPGPFAFADPDRVRGILSQAGLTDIAIDPFDTPMGGSDLEKTVALTFRIGPLGAALRERPELAGVVEGAVRSMLEKYVTPSGVFLPAAVWIVQARTPA
jgi:SAM-dependent methyltransferase